MILTNTSQIPHYWSYFSVFIGMIGYIKQLIFSDFIKYGCKSGVKVLSHISFFFSLFLVLTESLTVSHSAELFGD